MRAIHRTLQLTAVIVAAGTWSLAAQQIAAPQITQQDLRDGLKDPSRWLTYSGDYTNQRHSPLKQITPENVYRLTPQWVFQTETLGKFEASPLVVDAGTALPRAGRQVSKRSRRRRRPLAQSRFPVRPKGRPHPID